MFKSRAFVHVQHPMFDGRLYAGSANTPLKFFPNSYFLDGSYLKYFGKRDKRKVSLAWPREQYFYLAKNCVKMPSVSTEPNQIFAESNPKKRYYDCKYRRLFTSDYPFIRFEIGFEANKIILKNESDFRRLAKGLIRQKVIIKEPGECLKITPLISASFKRSMILAINMSTLSSKGQSDYRHGVVGGESVAVIDYIVEDLHSIKFSDRVLDTFLRQDLAGMRLSFFKERADLEECGVWLIGVEGGQDKHRLSLEAREIRIGILKLHAYVEGLFASIAQIHTYDDDKKNRLIDRYREAVGALINGTWHGMSFGPKQRFIIECYNYAYTNRLREILARVSEEMNMSEINKQQMMANVTINGNIYGGNDMTDRSVHNEGDGNQIVTGDYNKFRDAIININKGLDNTDANIEVIKALRDINEEFERLVRDSKPSEVMQKEIEERLKKINSEAVKEKPDKDYLKITSNGLIDAAETVAKIVGGPAVAAITSLMKLFP